MTKEELIQFLKDNLSIKIDLKRPHYDEGYLEVSLILNGDVISESYECVSLK